MMNRVTRIKGISDRRKLCPLGKIRLGIKVKKQGTDRRCKHPANEMCMFCSYPKEVDYFVCPPDIRAVYGEKPTRLKVRLPGETQDVVFPQAYRWYGESRGTKCVGDLEKAYRLVEGEERKYEEVACPCDKFEKECKKRAHLMVVLPDVSVGGVYQIDTSSITAIEAINSEIDRWGTFCRRYGRSLMDILFDLIRVPTEMHATGKKTTHHIVQIRCNKTEKELEEEFVQRGRMFQIAAPATSRFALPEPEDLNPELDDGAPVYIEGEVEDMETEPTVNPPSSAVGSPPTSPSPPPADPPKQKTPPRTRAKKETKDAPEKKYLDVVKEIRDEAAPLTSEDRAEIRQRFGFQSLEDLGDDLDLLLKILAEVKERVDEIRKKADEAGELPPDDSASLFEGQTL